MPWKEHAQGSECTQKLGEVQEILGQWATPDLNLEEWNKSKLLEKAARIEVSSLELVVELQSVSTSWSSDVLMVSGWLLLPLFLGPNMNRWQKPNDTETLAYDWHIITETTRHCALEQGQSPSNLNIEKKNIFLISEESMRKSQNSVWLLIWLT